MNSYGATEQLSSTVASSTASGSTQRLALAGSRLILTDAAMPPPPAPPGGGVPDDSMVSGAGGGGLHDGYLIHQHRVRTTTAPSESNTNATANTRIPVLVSDDIITGSQTEEGRMSPVRRFFCLLVTFDVLFTGLLWVITVVVTGQDLSNAMHHQVIEYNIHSSMFDCVMCASLRFATCIVFYALFGLHHWWPIALTTAGTSIFLIAKVFLYEWNHVGLLTFDVTLVLLSFILAWGELWFLDFRVLPLESKAKEVWLSSHRSLNNSNGYSGGGGGYVNNERAPLLGNNHRSAMMERYMETAETASLTGSNFYSLAPYTPGNSDDEDEDNSLEGDAADCRNFGRKKVRSDYKAIAKDVVETAWQTLTKSTDWKLESDSKSTGDRIESKFLDDRKIYRLTATLEIPARILLEELFYKVESSHLWNPLVTECKIVQNLDSNTDVMYQVCANGMGGGVVSTRDFVYFRHWELIEGVYVSALSSINHTIVPPQPNRVRGESGPCCFALRQSSSSPNKCTFQWLLNTDIKLTRLPRFVLDKAMMSSQSEFMSILRKRIITLKDELNLSTATNNTTAGDQGNAAAASLA